MKDNKNHKPFNNYSKQNKPLVASKGFNKFNKSEKPHFQPHHRKRNDDFDDYEDDEEYGSFKNFEKINRRNETAYGGKRKSNKSIKPANV